MARNKIFSTLVLLPVSKIFGAVVTLRNWMFDLGLFKQHTMGCPVIVVGNIAVGGTGETPHTEYIIDALRGDYRMAMLSRGYRRNTRGFVYATRRSRPEDIGDEPYQVYQKYGNEVAVAVCEKRVEGIRRVCEINPDINLMVLDDAFQHRYVKPTVAIVLMEFNKPPFYDSYLPYGRLREPMSALHRADVVVVTKCPDEMKPMEVRIFKENLGLFPYQKLFFSRYEYGHLVPVFPEISTTVPYLDRLGSEDTVLVISGVANPRPFVKFLRRYQAQVKVIRFPDHHQFTNADMEMIQETYNMLPGRRKIIITTEKDSVRLGCNPYFPHELKGSVFYIPIRVEFVEDRSESVRFDDALKSLLKDAALNARYK